MRDKDRESEYYPFRGYGNVNGDGRYMMKWTLGLFAAFLIVVVTACITWAVSEAGRVSALESGQAAINAKLEYIIKLVERKHGT